MTTEDYICIQINQDYARNFSRNHFKKIEVKNAAAVFLKSMEDAQNPVDMPAAVATATRQLAKTWAIAYYETTKKPWLGKLVNKKEAREMVIKKHHELYAMEKKGALFNLGDTPFSLLHTEHMNPELKLGDRFRSCVNAMLVYAWTAFEELAKTLYTNAAQEKPKRFASREGREKAFIKSFAKTAPSLAASITDYRLESFALLRNAIVHDNGIITKLDEFEGVASKQHEARLFLQEILVAGVGSRIPTEAALINRWVNGFCDATWSLIDEFDRC